MHSRISGALLTSGWTSQRAAASSSSATSGAEPSREGSTPAAERAPQESAIGVRTPRRRGRRRRTVPRQHEAPARVAWVRSSRQSPTRGCASSPSVPVPSPRGSPTVSLQGAREQTLQRSCSARGSTRISGGQLAARRSRRGGLRWRTYGHGGDSPRRGRCCMRWPTWRRTPRACAPTRSPRSWARAPRPPTTCSRVSSRRASPPTTAGSTGRGGCRRSTPRPTPASCSRTPSTTSSCAPTSAATSASCATAGSRSPSCAAARASPACPAWAPASPTTPTRWRWARWYSRGCGRPRWPATRPAGCEAYTPITITTSRAQRRARAGPRAGLRGRPRGVRRGLLLRRRAGHRRARRAARDRRAVGVDPRVRHRARRARRRVVGVAAGDGLVVPA